MRVHVKWGRETHDVDVDTSLPPLVFKTQLFTLTGVPPERQKIMGVKSPPLKARVLWHPGFSQPQRSSVSERLSLRTPDTCCLQDDADMAEAGLKEVR